MAMTPRATAPIIAYGGDFFFTVLFPALNSYFHVFLYKNKSRVNVFPTVLDGISSVIGFYERYLTATRAFLPIYPVKISTPYSSSYDAHEGLVQLSPVITGL